VQIGIFKKNLSKLSAKEKLEMIGDDPGLSIRSQCSILELNRSNYYYVAHPRQSSSMAFKEEIMQRLITGTPKNRLGV